MDNILCEELLQEILRRLPPSSSPSLSLVSRRWLTALRSSTTSLSLRLPPSSDHLSSLLSNYPFLSQLTLASDDHRAPNPNSNPDLLLAVLASSSCAGQLQTLRILPNSPLSSSSLLASAPAFRRLSSLHLAVLLPVDLRWLYSLPSLANLSLVRSRARSSGELIIDEDDGDDGGLNHQLTLENLCLSGVRPGDCGLSWLWRRCGNLRRLQLRACEGTGDIRGHFPTCLPGLVALELRTCRTIADRVLLLAAESCRSLNSLLLYDGGSREALHQFIRRRGAGLRTIDLRLPLDLHNDHLVAIAADDRGSRGGDGSVFGRNLAALRLQSCCLVTGDGLRSIAQAPVGAVIEELALVSCDVVEREPGLLTFLVQNMGRLQRLDLSHNESLTDKEVSSMLASCSNLVEIKLRGCGALTGATLSSLLKYCGRRLDLVDITRCPGIGVDAVEILALNACNLSQMIVEDSKVSEAAKNWMGKKAIRCA